MTYQLRHHIADIAVQSTQGEIRRWSMRLMEEKIWSHPGLTPATHRVAWAEYPDATDTGVYLQATILENAAFEQFAAESKAT
jgi:hypothetical protein